MKIRGSCFVDHDLSIPKGVSVEQADGFLGFSVGREVHEAKSTRTTGLTIRHDSHVLNVVRDQARLDFEPLDPACEQE